MIRVDIYGDVYDDGVSNDFETLLNYEEAKLENFSNEGRESEVAEDAERSSPKNA